MIGSRDEEELERHFALVSRLLSDSRVVPFFGAGANLCGRPIPGSWHEGAAHLPSGAELSEMGGSGDLFNSLHYLFDRYYPPTALHSFLAGLPNLLPQRCAAPRHQLIVTTHYDDLLEQAYTAAGEPFDLVTYARRRLPGGLPTGDQRQESQAMERRGQVVPANAATAWHGYR